MAVFRFVLQSREGMHPLESGFAVAASSFMRSKPLIICSCKKVLKIIIKKKIKTIHTLSRSLLHFVLRESGEFVFNAVLIFMPFSFSV